MNDVIRTCTVDRPDPRPNVTIELITDEMGAYQVTWGGRRFQPKPTDLADAGDLFEYAVNMTEWGCSLSESGLGFDPAS